jgi:hypothetical protein
MAKTKQSSAYAEKLKDPRWQKKRLEIMGRDDFRCQICGDSDSMLMVHHRYYIWGKEPWDYASDILVTLCEACHEAEHEEKDEADDLIKVLRCKGFSNKDLAALARAFHGDIQCPPDLTQAICFMLSSMEKQHTFTLAYDPTNNDGKGK